MMVEPMWFKLVVLVVYRSYSFYYQVNLVCFIRGDVALLYRSQVHYRTSSETLGLELTALFSSLIRSPSCVCIQSRRCSGTLLWWI